MAYRIYKQHQPVTIDGEDFGIECTLIREDAHDGMNLPEWWGIIAFDAEQAAYLVDLVNSSNDYDNPQHDMLQGRFVYDAELDEYTEYADNEPYDGEYPYNSAKGFDVDGVHLYELGSDWCWSIEE